MNGESFSIEMRRLVNARRPVVLDLIRRGDFFRFTGSSTLMIEKENGTDIQLNHRGINNADSYEGKLNGWKGVLDSLQDNASNHT